MLYWGFEFFFSSRRRHTSWPRDWSSDVCSSDLAASRGERADGDKADALRGWQSQASIIESRRISATEAEASAERDLLLQARLGDTNAALLQEQQARAAADTALSEQVISLQATVNDDISAAVQGLQQAVADEASARASAIQTVQASVGTAQDTADQAAQEAGQATAAVQTVSQAVADLDGDLSTMWSVKLQVNQNGDYVYAGVGLGIENGPGGLQSQFLVEANRFALLNTLNGVTTTPFVVEGGQVFMNSAVIKQADIVNLIVTGVLQSPDYVPETSGIRLNFVTGEFEVNATVPGQGRTTMTNRAIKVYDAQSPPRLRVQLGDLNA